MNRSTLRSKAAARLAGSALGRKTRSFGASVLCLTSLGAGVLGFGAVALAQSITIAPGTGNTTISQTSDGTTSVNIATPNQGTSLNTFTDFNVSQDGLVLNNSPEVTGTQTAGFVDANANLYNSGSASTIVNEVTGSSNSNLFGTIEVAGGQADVFIVNPNGVTCNGCSFVNTDDLAIGAATATAQPDGSVVMDTTDGGQVTIGNLGLDNSGGDTVTLFGQTISYDGTIVAGQEIRLIAGKETTFNTSTGEVLGGGTQSGVAAIDGTEFGAARAGAITIIATDAGMGVNTRGTLEATSGNISISAEGSVENSGTLTASNAVSISSDSLTNAGTITAGDVAAGTGSVGIEVAGSVVNVGTIEAGNVIQLLAGTKDIDWGAQTDANGDGRVDILDVAASDFGAGAFSNGDGTNEGTMTATNISLVAGSIANDNGTITASGALSLTLTGGGDESGADYSTAAMGLGNTAATGGGIWSADTGVSLNVLNRNLVLDQDLSETAPLVFNAVNGSLSVAENTDVTTTEDMILVGGSDVTVGAGVTLTGQNVQLQSGAHLSNLGGIIDAGGDLVATAVGNILTMAGGTNQAADSVQMQAGGDITNAGTQSAGADLLLIAAGNFDNQAGGSVSAVGNTTISGETSLTNAGDVTSGVNTVLVSDGAIINDSGTVDATGTLVLQGDTITNQNAGQLIAGSDMTLLATTSILNLGSKIEGGANINLLAPEFRNVADYTVTTGRSTREVCNGETWYGDCDRRTKYTTTTERLTSFVAAEVTAAGDILAMGDGTGTAMDLFENNASSVTSGGDISIVGTTGINSNIELERSDCWVFQTKDGLGRVWNDRDSGCTETSTVAQAATMDAMDNFTFVGSIGVDTSLDDISTTTVNPDGTTGLQGAVINGFDPETIQFGSSFTNSGSITAGGTLSITADYFQNGLFGQTLGVGSLDTDLALGSLVGAGGINIITGTGINTGFITSDGLVRIEADSFANVQRVVLQDIGVATDFAVTAGADFVGDGPQVTEVRMLQEGGEISGNNVTITTSGDLQNVGGLLLANGTEKCTDVAPGQQCVPDGNLTLTVGGNFDNVAQVSDQFNWWEDPDQILGTFTVGKTTEYDVADDYTSANVLASGALNIIVDGDATISGSNLGGYDGVQLIAGGDILVEDLVTEGAILKQTKECKFFGSLCDETSIQTIEVATGGVYSVSGDTTLIAGSTFDDEDNLVQTNDAANITTNGGTISSALGSVTLQAANNVTMNAVTAQVDQVVKQADLGFLSVGETEVLWNDTVNKTTSLSAGEDLTIIAGQDIYGEGTQAGAGGDIAMQFGGDATFEASIVDNYFEVNSWSLQVTGTGIDDVRTVLDRGAEGLWDNYKASTPLSSLETLANLEDGQPGVNQAINSIVGLTNTVGGWVDYTLDANSINQISEAVGQAFDPFAKYRGLEDGAFSVGVAFNSSQQRDDWQSAITSTLTAGEDMIITGAGPQSNLNLLDGTQARAGDDIVITKIDELNIEGLALESSSRSSSFGFTVNTSFGKLDGAAASSLTSVSVGLNGSKSSSQATTWTNGGLVAGTGCSAGSTGEPGDPCGALVVATSGDMNVIAANVHGNVVDLDVGGDLTVESRQNTSSSKGSNWGVNISVDPTTGLPTSFGVNGGRNSAESAMTGVMASITSNGQMDIDVGEGVRLVGAVIGSQSNELSLTAETFEVEHLEDYSVSSSSSFGFSLSGSIGSKLDDNNEAIDGEFQTNWGLPTFNVGSSSSSTTGTTYGTLGQGTYVIGGETFVHDQGATLTDDQIAYLTQNPGSTQANTPQAVLASDQYQMTQENFVENVVLDSGALDVVAGSQDYELIYTLNGEWTPTQQGLFDTAMNDTLKGAFEGDYSNAGQKLDDLIAGITDGSLSAADLGLPEGTSSEDALAYLNGLKNGPTGEALTDEQLAANLAAQLDPPVSDKCWEQEGGSEANCDGLDGDMRMFAGGDAIIAEDGPLAGANLNVAAAQTRLDVVETSFQLDLNLEALSQFEESLEKANNLLNALVTPPPAEIKGDPVQEEYWFKMLLGGNDRDEALERIGSPQWQEIITRRREFDAAKAEAEAYLDANPDLPEETRQKVLDQFGPGSAVHVALFDGQKVTFDENGDAWVEFGQDCATLQSNLDCSDASLMRAVEYIERNRDRLLDKALTDLARDKAALDALGEDFFDLSPAERLQRAQDAGYDYLLLLEGVSTNVDLIAGCIQNYIDVAREVEGAKTLLEARLALGIGPNSASTLYSDATAEELERAFIAAGLEDEFNSGAPLTEEQIAAVSAGMSRDMFASRGWGPSQTGNISYYAARLANFFGGQNAVDVIYGPGQSTTVGASPGDIRGGYSSVNGVAVVTTEMVEGQSLSALEHTLDATVGDGSKGYTPIDHLGGASTIKTQYQFGHDNYSWHNRDANDSYMPSLVANAISGKYQDRYLGFVYGDSGQTVCGAEGCETTEPDRAAIILTNTEARRDEFDQNLVTATIAVAELAACVTPAGFLCDMAEYERTNGKAAAVSAMIGAATLGRGSSVGRVARLGDRVAELRRLGKTDAEIYDSLTDAQREVLRQSTDEFAQGLRGTSAPNGGTGSFSPSQPLGPDGLPIVRTNDRSGVLVQPNGSVTCGQHACGMVLNTQGRAVSVDDIIKNNGPDFPNGSSPSALQAALRDNGVSNTFFPRASVDDLARFTANGRPAIATVRTGPNTYHAVVVDGVTTRGGQRVVALRDPAGYPNGGVYYETVESFQARFNGNAIRMDTQ